MKKPPVADLESVLPVRGLELKLVYRIGTAFLWACKSFDSDELSN